MPKGFWSYIYSDCIREEENAFLATGEAEPLRNDPTADDGNHNRNLSNRNVDATDQSSQRIASPNSSRGVSQTVFKNAITLEDSENITTKIETTRKHESRPDERNNLDDNPVGKNHGQLIGQVRGESKETSLEQYNQQIKELNRNVERGQLNSIDYKLKCLERKIQSDKTLKPKERKNLDDKISRCWTKYEEKIYTSQGRMRPTTVQLSGNGITDRKEMNVAIVVPQTSYQGDMPMTTQTTLPQYQYSTKDQKRSRQFEEMRKGLESLRQDKEPSYPDAPKLNYKNLSHKNDLLRSHNVVIPEDLTGIQKSILNQQETPATQRMPLASTIEKMQLSIDAQPSQGTTETMDTVDAQEQTNKGQERSRYSEEMRKSSRSLRQDKEPSYSDAPKFNYKYLSHKNDSLRSHNVAIPEGLTGIQESILNQQETPATQRMPLVSTIEKMQLTIDAQPGQGTTEAIDTVDAQEQPTKDQERSQYLEKMRKGSGSPRQDQELSYPDAPKLNYENLLHKNDSLRSHNVAIPENSTSIQQSILNQQETLASQRVPMASMIKKILMQLRIDAQPSQGTTKAMDTLDAQEQQDNQATGLIKETCLQPAANVEETKLQEDNPHDQQYNATPSPTEEAEKCARNDVVETTPKPQEDEKYFFCYEISTGIKWYRDPDNRTLCRVHPNGERERFSEILLSTEKVFKKDVAYFKIPNGETYRIYQANGEIVRIDLPDKRYDATSSPTEKAEKYARNDVVETTPKSLEDEKYFFCNENSSNIKWYRDPDNTTLCRVHPNGKLERFPEILLSTEKVLKKDVAYFNTPNGDPHCIYQADGKFFRIDPPDQQFDATTSPTEEAEKCARNDVVETTPKVPETEILDLAEHFVDEFKDYSDKHTTMFMMKVKEKAESYIPKIEKLVIQYFVIQESLMMLIETLAKVNCQLEPEVYAKKIEAINCIKELIKKLDSRVVHDS